MGGWFDSNYAANDFAWYDVNCDSNNNYVKGFYCNYEPVDEPTCNISSIDNNMVLCETTDDAKFSWYQANQYCNDNYKSNLISTPVINQVYESINRLQFSSTKYWVGLYNFIVLLI